MPNPTDFTSADHTEYQATPGPIDHQRLLAAGYPAGMLPTTTTTAERAMLGYLVARDRLAGTSVPATTADLPSLVLAGAAAFGFDPADLYERERAELAAIGRLVVFDPECHPACRYVDSQLPAGHDHRPDRADWRGIALALTATWWGWLWGTGSV